MSDREVAWKTVVLGNQSALTAPMVVRYLNLPQPEIHELWQQPRPNLSVLLRHGILLAGPRHFHPRASSLHLSMRPVTQSSSSGPVRRLLYKVPPVIC